ncbi:hypothetical protein OQA88_7330 [Cercophora sp. LCS_1]
MLRPATPLAVLLFAAFALLLLAVLSTPIIEAVPLGSFEGASFGVFGFCKDGVCSPIEIGYDPRFAPAEPDDFNLPTATRATLSAILIVHPVAALLTLAMFVLAVIAHFHSPSHSARYLLVLFIVGLVDFLCCLLCFLIDVLLFVPHMAWGSYIVLAATILVALSGLISCAMRRTVVSRKARKKRIAQNAEMSGENFYNRQAQQSTLATAVTQPTVPMVSGGNGGADGLPSFATYEKKDDRSSDERIPLTSRSPSETAPTGTTLVTDQSTSPIDGIARSLTNTPASRDQYGNPAAPQDAYGMRGGPSFESMNGRGRGGGPQNGYRGRGGYGGPGRGGYNGYGAPPPNARGGYGQPARGGYGAPINSRGGYGPPTRGFGGRGGRTPPPPNYQVNQGSYDSAYDRRPSAGPYGARQQSPGPPSAPGYGNQGGYGGYNPQNDLPRAESPPPLPGIDDGVAHRPPVEMDAGAGGQQPYGIRDSDADVAGMLALQQARTSASTYSQDEGQYVPPRQGWNQGPGRNSPGVPSPLNVPARPAELPQTRGSPQPAPAAADYYEDVDPRFAEPGVPQKPTPPPIQTTNTFEDIPEDTPQGPRSPAESEQSTFTSISQRGINPRWQPPPMPTNLGVGRPPRRPTDILSSNPDFELPTRGTPPRRRGGYGM